MELQDLRCFMAVAQHLNFTRAADSLHVTQPTLSRRIRDLEVELGTQLFNRDYHQVSLTPKGSALERVAYEVLQQVDSIPTVLNLAGANAIRSTDVLEGMLRVGHQANIDYRLASRAVDKMGELHPNVKVFVSRHGLGDLRDDLRGGILDVAVMLLSEYDQHRGMTAYKIGTSRVQVIVSSGHRFATRKTIEIGELAGEDIIMIERAASPQTVDFVNGRCFENGFSLHAKEYVNDAENVMMRVSAGHGIAFAHSKSMLMTRMNDIGIAVLDISDADMNLDLVVARREDDDSPVVAEYLDIIKRLSR